MGQIDTHQFFKASKIISLILSVTLISCTKGSNNNSSSAPAIPDTSENLGQLKLSVGPQSSVGQSSFSMNNVSSKASNGSGPKSNPSSNSSFSAIYIDIDEVAVHSEENGWSVVNSNKQTLELISLSQNATSILANRRLAPGTYDQIRIILAGNVRGIINSQEVSIKVPSGSQTGIKINGRFTIQKGLITSISMFFNPNKSVVEKGNGQYSLKPVIELNSVQEDLVAPIIAITHPVANSFSNVASQNVVLEYSDDNIDITTLKVLIDGVDKSAAFLKTDTSAQATIVFTEGSHHIEASIADLAPNVGTATPIDFVVDLTPPVVVLAQSQMLTNSTNPQIKATVTDALSGINPTSFLVTVDGVNVTSNFALSGSQLSGQVALAEGIHAYTVSIRDMAGNSTSATGQITVDITPPVLSNLKPLGGSTIYRNVQNINISGTSNEKLSAATINGINASLDSGLLNFSATIPFSSSGLQSFAITATDLAGNTTTVSLPLNLIFDNTPPTIAVLSSVPSLTKNPSLSLSVKVLDESPTDTLILANGLTSLFESTSSSFNANITLHEGLNLLSVQSTDAAGNVATYPISPIMLDTIPPQITVTSPVDGSTLTSLNIPIQGTTDEAVSLVMVNGKSLTIGANQKFFSGTITAQVEGVNTLNFLATDLAGNQGTLSVSVNVNSRILVPALVSVVPGSGTTLNIQGAMGATKPGIKVSFSSGFLSTVSTTTNSDGSFLLVSDFFTSGILSAYDSVTGKSDSTTLSFKVDTSLSGSVKDSDGNPLPQVRVLIENSTLTTITDTGGVFYFPGPVPTGDQYLAIDPTAIPASIIGQNKKFNKIRIPLSIGRSQSNVLTRTIYLAPQMLDGTQTVIVSGSSATVTSPYAPGVKINLPTNSVVFPDGTNSGSINIGVVAADHATVPHPDFATPQNVISLEPSGLKFNQPVDLTLPNDAQLPAGTNAVILSMNSSKGKWEIDGAASVSLDGQSIVTKPGQGITHFSEVYAVPIAPIMLAVGKPGSSGANLMDGTVSTSIELPSFKTLGGMAKPKLLYNSSWAMPTAVVRNYLDFPTRNVQLINEPTIENSFNRVIDVSSCILGFCFHNYIDFYGKVRYDIKDTVDTSYIPNSVSAQFLIGNLKSEKLTFNNPPMEAMIGFAQDLKSPVDNSFFKSGLYIAKTKLELNIHNTVLTTRDITTEVTSNLQGPQISKETIQTRNEFDQIFPQDISNYLAVQNEIGSPVGRGWKVAGIQKILNPGDEKVAIDNGDGSVSTYGVQNTISTLFDGGAAGVNLQQGVDLQNWRKVIAFSTADSGPIIGDMTNTGYVNEIFAPVTGGPQTKYGQIDLSSSSPSFSAIQTVQNDQGYQFEFHMVGYGNYGYYPRAYKVPRTPSKAILMADGSLVFTEAKWNNLMKVDTNGLNSAYRFTSELFPRPDYGPSINNTGNLDSACPNVLGYSCPRIPDKYGSNYYFFWWEWYSLVPFVETMSGGASSTLGFNQPLDIIRSPDGRLTLSDSGNNRVITLNLDNITNFKTFGGYIATDALGWTSSYTLANYRFTPSVSGSAGNYISVAGNQQTYDNGDGGSALQASIFHPRGLLYDAYGNLFISTERGFIRRIDAATGVITTYAGRPASDPTSVLAINTDKDHVQLSSPTGMVIDNQNSFLYVADTGNNRVVRIDMNTGSAATVAGAGSSSAPLGDNGAALNASLNAPTWLGLDDNLNLIIVDSGHNKIRRVIFNSVTTGPLVYQPDINDLSNLQKNNDGTWVRTYRNGSIVKFDSNGHQISALDRAGNQMAYSYDGNGNISEIKDPVGQIIQFNYSGNQLVSITDPANKTTSLNNSGNLLASVTLPDGSTKSYSYDSNGRLISETDLPPFIGPTIMRLSYFQHLSSME